MFVRPLNPEECQALEVGLKSRDGLVLKRSQVLLASHRRQPVAQIAQQVGCCRQTIRNILAAFHQRGLDSLPPGSTRPHSAAPELDQFKLQRLQEILHQSPRLFGKPRSTWTLQLAAEVAFEQKLSDRVLSLETIRSAVGRLGGGWKRAKQWITSPDPLYALKKNGGTD